MELEYTWLRTGWFARSIAVAGSLCVASAVALAATGKDTSSSDDQKKLDAHFAGKTITIISPYNAGGGSDTVARGFERFAPKYFPPGTRFSVQNIPGGNGDAGTRKALSAAPDGLSLALLFNSVYLGAMLGSSRPGWSWQDFKPVITYSFPQEPYPWLVRKDFATSWDDVASAKRGIARIGVTTGLSGLPGLLQLAGLPVKVIAGYSTNAETMAAADRGEVDIPFGSLPVLLNTYPNWIKEGKMVPLFKTGRAPMDDRAMKALGLTKQPPHVLEAVKLPEDLRQVFLDAEQLPTYHTLYTPAKTPPEILNYLRRKMEQVVADPDFKAWAEERGLSANHLSGEQLEARYKTIVNRPSLHRKLLAAYLAGDPKLLQGTPYEGRLGASKAR